VDRPLLVNETLSPAAIDVETALSAPSFVSVSRPHRDRSPVAVHLRSRMSVPTTVPSATRPIPAAAGRRRGGGLDVTCVRHDIVAARACARQRERQRRLPRTGVANGAVSTLSCRRSPCCPQRVRGARVSSGASVHRRFRARGAGVAAAAPEPPDDPDDPESDLATIVTLIASASASACRRHHAVVGQRVMATAKVDPRRPWRSPVGRRLDRDVTTDRQCRTRWRCS
jgi:hypothetical protein